MNTILTIIAIIIYAIGYFIAWVFGEFQHTADKKMRLELNKDGEEVYVPVPLNKLKLAARCLIWPWGFIKILWFIFVTHPIEKKELEIKNAEFNDTQ